MRLSDIMLMSPDGLHWSVGTTDGTGGGLLWHAFLYEMLPSLHVHIYFTFSLNVASESLGILYPGGTGVFLFQKKLNLLAFMDNSTNLTTVSSYLL